MRGTRLIKNSIFDIFNKSFMFLFSWVVSIWIARKLGPEEYGIFNLILWFNGVVLWLIGMGLVHGITKFVAEAHAQNQRDHINSLLRFVIVFELIVSTAFTLLCLFCRTWIADYFFTPQQTFLFTLTFLGLIPGTATAIFSAAIEGIQKFEYFTLANLIISPLSFISKIMVLIWGNGISGLLEVMLIFSCINTIFYIIVLYKENITIFAKPIKLPQEVKKRLLKFNLSVCAITICDKVIWDKSENFFIGRWCSAKELGLYNLGYNLTQRLNSTLPDTFWRVLFPAMSSYCGSGQEDKMRRIFFLSTRYLASICIPIGLLGCIIAYQLIYYLYGESYIQSTAIVQILFLGSLVTSLCSPGAAVLYGYEKQNSIIIIGFITALLNILLNCTLIKPYGAVGASISYCISTVLGSIAGTIYTCKIMKLQFPFHSIGKILLATLSAALSMVFILHFNTHLVGTSSAIIVGTLCYCTISLLLCSCYEEDIAVVRHLQKHLPEQYQKKLEVLILLVVALKRVKKQ